MLIGGVPKVQAVNQSYHRLGIYALFNDRIVKFPSLIYVTNDVTNYVSTFFRLAHDHLCSHNDLITFPTQSVYLA